MFRRLRTRVRLHTHDRQYPAETTQVSPEYLRSLLALTTPEEIDRCYSAVVGYRTRFLARHPNAISLMDNLSTLNTELREEEKYIAQNIKAVHDEAVEVVLFDWLVDDSDHMVNPSAFVHALWAALDELAMILLQYRDADQTQYKYIIRRLNLIINDCRMLIHAYAQLVMET